MAVAPVVSGSPDVAAPPEEPQASTWVVQPGDTLGGIARRLQQEGMPGTTAELVRTLARMNGLSNPDRIEVGQPLRLPDWRPRATAAGGDVLSRLTAHLPRLSDLPLFNAAEREALLHGALLRLTGGASAAPAQAEPRRAPDGTPLFRQGDPAWRSQRLGVAGDGPTLAHAGCALTACAMALSRLGNTVVTPDALLSHLRQGGGFQGPLLDWSVAGSAIPAGPRACPGDLDCGALDGELDRGRPVLLRVVHDVHGREQQHWICLTGRDPRTGEYTANDPATGRTTVLVKKDGALASAGGEPVAYASDGRMVTFARSRPDPA